MLYLFDTNEGFLGKFDQVRSDAPYLGSTFLFSDYDSKWYELYWNPHARTYHWRPCDIKLVPNDMKAMLLLVKD